MAERCPRNQAARKETRVIAYALVRDSAGPSQDAAARAHRMRHAWLSLILSAWLVTITGCAPSGAPSVSADTAESDQPTVTETDALKTELIAMADRDQELRTKGMDEGLSSEDRADFARQCGEADQVHTARLKEIVDRHGWPTISMVGKDASFAAFLLVQHADRDPAFQARCLPMLEAAAEQGEVSRTALAYLTDRVRVKQERPQVYGTQYQAKKDEAGNTITGADGQFNYLLPLVEDIDRLDERRRAAGLGPWAEYEKRMAELHKRDPVERPRSAN